MPNKKIVIGNIITGIVVGLFLMFATGFVRKSNAVQNAASKDDLKKTKNEMISYTDKSIQECKDETQLKISSIDAIHNETIKSIKQDVKDIKEGQTSNADRQIERLDELYKIIIELQKEI